jgi:hypothetical protein
MNESDTNAKDLMLLLSPEEHRYLMDLVLDFGAYQAPKGVRNRVVQKLSVPFPVRDVRGEPAPTARAREADALAHPGRRPLPSV